MSRSPLNTPNFPCAPSFWKKEKKSIADFNSGFSLHPHPPLGQGKPFASSVDSLAIDLKQLPVFRSLFLGITLSVYLIFRGFVQTLCEKRVEKEEAISKRFVYNIDREAFPMKVPTFEPNTRYSYKDYLLWDKEERWELIDGVPYNMTPAPSSKHQEVLGHIFVLFYNYLIDKRCKAYLAPFEVRLSNSDKAEEIYNVVQPDLSVICNRHKIDDRGCKGSPDLIVEVLSPGLSAKRDKVVKYELYEKYKIKEYWIVDPYNENIEVFTLENGHYQGRDVYVKGDVFTVSIFRDLLVDVNQIFRDEESFD